MYNENRVFCQECGQSLRIWSDPDFSYEQWLETPCRKCHTKPSDSRYQDSDIFLADPMAAALGAVVLKFEQLSIALRTSIFMFCFGEESKREMSEAMLEPLSFAQQAEVFSAVFLIRFPEKEAGVKRMRKRLIDSAESRNRLLHSWWLPGHPFLEAGTRVNTRISSGKLKKDVEPVSIRQLTHLAAYFNKLQSDLLQLTMETLSQFPPA